RGAGKTSVAGLVRRTAGLAVEARGRARAGRGIHRVAVPMKALPLALILVVAAYGRLSHPELTWVSVDQARDVSTALGIVSGRAFPLVGVEVAGGPAHAWGPAYFYLIAIPFAVSGNPSFAVGVLGAVSLAGVFMTYRLGAVFFGRAVGLLAASLLSTYP